MTYFNLNPILNIPASKRMRFKLRFIVHTLKFHLLRSTNREIFLFLWWSCSFVCWSEKWLVNFTFNLYLLNSPSICYQKCFQSSLSLSPLTRMLLCVRSKEWLANFKFTLYLLSEFFSFLPFFTYYDVMLLCMLTWNFLYRNCYITQIETVG